MKKRTLGISVIIILSIIPLILWVMAEPWANRFYNNTSILASFGQLTGLLGITLFAVNLILSARIKWIQPYFAGLNRIYSLHHRLGTYAFILLLLHPLILAVKFFMFSRESGWNFITPSLDNWPKLYGMLALIFMFVFLAFTYWVKIKYEKWRWTHKFLGAAFFIGSLHAFIIPSDISRFLPLKIYMLLLTVLSVAAYIYHSWLGGWLVKKYKYEVINIQHFPPNICEISMKALDEAMKYVSGQFVFIEFIGEKIKKEVHPFSISSTSSENVLKIAVKDLGDYTSTLDRLENGDFAIIEGPYGVFNCGEGNFKDQIWIGGGIGITPFLSMARDLKNKSGYQIDLVYAVGYDKEAVFIRELKSIAKVNKNFRVIPYYSKKEGYLSAGYLLNLGISFKNKSIFICGPASMMKILKQQFVDEGVRLQDIHTEEFELI